MKKLQFGLMMVFAILLSGCVGGIVEQRVNATLTAQAPTATPTLSVAQEVGTAVAQAMGPQNNATPEPDMQQLLADLCPTRREVNDMLFGVDADGNSYDRVVEVSTEDGAWQVNTGDPEFYYSVNLPEWTITTLHRPEADQAEVYDNLNGQVDESLEMFRMTVRFQGCYDPSDDMWADDAAVRILVKENFNGTFQTWMQNKRVQDWQFAVVAGNFDCPPGVCPSPNVADNSAAARTTAQPASCPQFGGQPTQPGNDGAPYCKYTGTVVTEAVPQGYKVDYWDGNAVQYASEGDTVTTGEATFRPLR